MISHMFKMMWSRRKRNFFLLLQLFIAFVAMFFFTGLNLKKLTNYFRPVGYNYQDAWVVDFEYRNATDEQKTAFSDVIRQKLVSIPGVQGVSATDVVPFHSWGREEKFRVGAQVYDVAAFDVDEHYNDVLDIKLVAGKWFSEKDKSLHTQPIVVTADLADQYFGGANAIGKEVVIGDKPARIIGISQTFKENTSADVEPGFFIAKQDAPARFLIKTAEAGNFQLMEEKVRKSIASIGSEQIIQRQNSSLTLIRKYAHKLDYIQLSIAMIIFVFLVINIFLGVSGVFTYNLSKRQSEVGLRVAVGADRSAIVRQLLGETIVLTTIGIFPGLLIAIQMVIMQYFDAYYGMLSIVLAALFLYLLMLSCALYPTLKASKLQPAVALHQE